MKNLSSSKLFYCHSTYTDSNGKNSFHSHLMNMSEYLKLPDFNPDLLDIAIKNGKKLCKFHEKGIYLILAKHPSTFSKT